MANEYERFSGKIWETGNSLVITLPEQILNFGDYKKGDVIKVMIKKEVKQDGTQ